jgi:cytochrome oxidase Cu insertion factor (SCO1/SenC/PrrC family)
MPGMGQNNVSLTNPLVVSLFHHSIYVTSVYWIIAVALALLLGATMLRRLNSFNLSKGGLSEPRARTYLRTAFGVIWLFDGILQFQASMPLGLANDVVRPAVAGAPSWLHPLMFDGIHAWNSHPIALATGTAWIQVGIGLALIASNAGVGRLAALVSVFWAGIIWTIGNGVGGAFASGSSILFGWPGASLIYLVAGLWLVLPPDYFSRNFSRYTLRGISIILGVALVLQCLPSAEFWHGGNTNALTAMSRAMTQTAQPQSLSWIVRHVGDLAGTLGGGFNVIVILWLAACAVGLWFASTGNLRWPVVTLIVGAVIVWVVGEDVSIFGGVATDINSMIPLAVLASCASPSLRTSVALPRRLPEELRSSSGAVLASFASAMVLFSVVSMGLATIASAEPTLFIAQNGISVPADSKAPVFTLTDQFNKPFTLEEHAGRYTLLTFLDPVCWTDCPLLAAQLKKVRDDLSPNAPLDIVVVAANPLHQTLANVKHFIKIHELDHVTNFYFVTGKLANTKAVWKSYGVTVTNEPGAKMSIHSDYMFIIDPAGHLKWIVPDDPLSGTAGQLSTESELLGLLHKAGLN